MAKKGQVFRKHSPEFKILVILDKLSFLPISKDKKRGVIA